MVGIETADDAAVYRVSDELAVISTVDFITPPVDDPYWFGQIAAANSISDIYSMGGKPLTALNLVMFPIKQLDLGLLRDILRGDDICRVCVVAWWLRPEFLAAAGAVGGGAIVIDTIEDNPPPEASPFIP